MDSSDRAKMIGKCIDSMALADDSTLVLAFTDGTGAVLKCAGDCCAKAYFTDLELASPLPATIMEWSDRSGEQEDDGQCDVKDTHFVKIETSRGYIDFTMHTEHNGYYGGDYFVEYWSGEDWSGEDG